MIEHNGKSQTIAAWSRETGIAAPTIRKRLFKGWSVDRALTAPLDTRGRKKEQQPVEVIELTAYRDLERMMLGLKHDLNRSIAAFAQAKAQAAKAIEKAEENLKSRSEHLLQAGLREGVVPNILKSTEHRSFPVAQETIQMGKFK